MGTHNIFKLSIYVFSVFLIACTTTRDATQSNSPATYDNPKQSSSDERAKIRLQLGIDYFQQDQLDTALKEVNNAIAIDSALADAYAVRALIYMQMRDTSMAEQDFARVVAMAPDNSDNKNNYGWFLCMNGREKQGIQLFDQVINDRNYNQPIKALNNAGLCSLMMKDDVSAEKYFTESLRFDANNATTNLNLARLNFKRNDLTHAKFYVDRLIKEEAYTPEILWLAIKINHQLNDSVAMASLEAQLKRRYPESKEFDAMQRGAFND